MAMVPSTKSAIPSAATETQIWPEPLETPGLVPRHLKRSATSTFPILEVLQRLLYRLRPHGSSGGDLERVLAIIGLYQAIKPVYTHLKDFLLWAFTVQITVPESDAVAKEVLTWMGSEIVNKSRTRSAMLVTGGIDNMSSHPMTYTIPGSGVDRVEEEVLCLPPIGTRLFWVGFRPYLFSRTGGQALNRNNSMVTGNIVNDRGQLQNALTITTIGWSLAPLHAFTDMCHDFKLKNRTGTTNVYFAGGHSGSYGDGWQSVCKAIRKLDTIDMDEDIKSDLIKDAEYYYSEQSRRFFADCGIPYRRGYLFHGPPGTGKSSFSAALAGHLQCDIYHINLSSGDISDGVLHRLFLSLPRKVVVVIEDIDSAGIGREQGPSSKAALGKAQPTHPPSKLPEGVEYDLNHMLLAHHRRKRNTVTLSGLLNAIDGNSSQEGRLLIMTSNNPESLDAALTRPGRIDKKVYFGNMSRNAGKSIFKRLIGRSALAHDAAFTMEEMEQFATDFTNKVPPETFTPAQVQNFLQGCRGDPHKALSEIDAWVEEMRDQLDGSASQTSEPSSSIVSLSPHMAKASEENEKEPK